jgi:hypothetical protein
MCSQFGFCCLYDFLVSLKMYECALLPLMQAFKVIYNQVISGLKKITANFAKLKVFHVQNHVSSIVKEISIQPFETFVSFPFTH